jgi:predicted ester cyclase
MYGTIARVITQPGKVSDVKALGEGMDGVPGQVVRYVFQADAHPDELWFVGIFESKEAYWANARSAEQHARYLQLRDLLAADPEWHDGEVIDAAFMDRHTAVVRRVYDELINQENKAVVEETFAPDVVIHDPFMGTMQGMDAFHQLLGMFDAAFPHHRVTVDEIVAQGDLVCVMHTHTATHTGPFMGTAPTGRSIVVNGMELFRLAGGKIVEFWRKDDDASMLMQLGILSAPVASEG